MSLLKQLLILLSILILLVLSANFILSVGNIRSYLEDEAQVHAQDTATSLGLSLSPYMVDENDPIIETMMSSIFDMGYYQEITLLNIDGKTLVTLKNNNTYEGVPSWFVNNLPMKIAKAGSEISSGWNISGVLEVTANPGFAYIKLYQQAKNSFYFSLFVLFISIVLLFLLLRITLSSLKRISQTALKIADGDFEKITPLPWTTEAARVANSMNTMSGKIGGIIANLNAKLKYIGTKLEQDDLTGLKKKTSFERDIKELLTEGKSGYFFIIKVDVLSDLVKEMGGSEVDLFLQRFAELLKNTIVQMDNMDVTPYRFFGGEFAFLISEAKPGKIKQLADVLTEEIDSVSLQYQQIDIAHSGIVNFTQVDSVDGVLLAADEAYEQARIIGNNSYYIKENIGIAKNIAEWKTLVFNVIENDQYRLSFVNKVQNLEHGELIMEDAFTEVFDTVGEQVSIATFVSIAEKFVKIVDLDKGVTQKALDYIRAEDINHFVTVSLSTRTIKNSDFRSWLTKLFEENDRCAEKLVFSFSAYAVTKEMSVYKAFMTFIHQLGGKVLIKRFDANSVSPELITQLKPDYIRLARKTSEGISSSNEKKLFVQTMKEIGDLSDINIVLENIVDDEDFQCIKDIGILGASR